MLQSRMIIVYGIASHLIVRSWPLAGAKQAGHGLEHSGIEDSVRAVQQVQHV
jgi:hypothetical protein